MRKLKFALFSLTIIAIFAGAAETVLRLANINPKVDNPFFMLVRVFEYPDYFQKDEKLFWRLRKNLSGNSEFLVEGNYRTNSLGLRGGQIELDDTTSLRIACFGNSCTFGWRLSESETYPLVIQTKLNANNSTVVYNCGIPGYSSFQGYRLMQEYLPILQPHYVTICYGWNDHWAAAFDLPDKEQQTPPQTILDIQNLLSRSYLYRTIKFLLLSQSEQAREYSYNREAPLYRVSIEDYRNNLLAMVKLVRESGAIPILLTAPIGDADSNSDTPLENYHRLYNQIVRTVAEDGRVFMIDAAVGFGKHPEYIPTPASEFIHYNAAGARWIGEQIAAVIRDINSGRTQNSPM